MILRCLQGNGFDQRVCIAGGWDARERGRFSYLAKKDSVYRFREERVRAAIP